MKRQILLGSGLLAVAFSAQASCGPADAMAGLTATLSGFLDGPLPYAVGVGFLIFGVLQIVVSNSLSRAVPCFGLALWPMFMRQMMSMLGLDPSNMDCNGSASESTAVASSVPAPVAAPAPSVPNVTPPALQSHTMTTSELVESVKQGAESAYAAVAHSPYSEYALLAFVLALGGLVLWKAMPRKIEKNEGSRRWRKSVRPTAPAVTPQA